MHPSQFWWRQWRVPLVAFAIAATLFATTSLDFMIARMLFFDASREQWIGAHSWWTNELIHTGGRWLIRCVVAAALAVWIATFLRPRLQAWRRPTAYFICAVVLSVGVVGLLKTLTNVDCPRDLTEFGGAMPFIALFADRPDGLAHARCFPAAHASSGYALLALYFVFREYSRRLSRYGLMIGAVFGLIFGIAQQARGAHFASHDVWSAFLVWTVSLSLYTVAFKARLWHYAPLSRSKWECNEASAPAPRLPVGGNADLPHRVGSVPGT